MNGHASEAPPSRWQGDVSNLLPSSHSPSPSSARPPSSSAVATSSSSLPASPVLARGTSSSVAAAAAIASETPSKAWLSQKQGSEEQKSENLHRIPSPTAASAAPSEDTLLDEDGRSLGFRVGEGAKIRVAIKAEAGENSQQSNGSSSTTNVETLSSDFRGEEKDEERLNASEEFGALMDKAYQKFARLRELPPYGRNKWDLYYHKAFHVYAKLWKFQQERRQKLVETGLKRWEIGEIASRIGQLYYNYYLRTSEATFLFEAHIFYEAINTREYFKDNARLEPALANKQLRYLARFVVVCLLLNRREMVRKLLRQLRMLVDDYSRYYQTADAKEWRLIVHEILRFMKADAACEGTRSIRYSVLLDPSPGALPPVTSLLARFAPASLKLQEAILTSYYQNEVKFSELTLDTFRMLQAIEWEPCGSFLRSRTGEIVSSALGGVGVNPTRVGGIDENIVDPTLPSNPHKYILYRPSVPQLLLVLATAVEELPRDSVLLLYISASGLSPHNISPISSPAGENEPTNPRSMGSSQRPTGPVTARIDLDNGTVTARHGTPPPLHIGSLESEASDTSTPGTSPGSAPITPRPSSGELAPNRGGSGRPRLSRVVVEGEVGEGEGGEGRRDGNGRSTGVGVWLGSRRDSREHSGGGIAVQNAAKAAGDSFLYPEDLLPFTRRPLFFIVDSDSSPAFEVLSGEERGEPVAMLLSPVVQPAGERERGERGASLRPLSTGGNLFTFFLTAPLLAFCRLANVSIVNMPPTLYESAERQLAMELSSWGAALAALSSLSPAWARLLGDPFIRQFVLRFVFCRAAISLHSGYRNRSEYLPRCLPPLPPEMLPMATSISSGIFRLATSLGITEQFAAAASSGISRVGEEGGKERGREEGREGEREGERSSVSGQGEGMGVPGLVRAIPRVPPGFERTGSRNSLEKEGNLGFQREEDKTVSVGEVGGREEGKVAVEWVSKAGSRSQRVGREKGFSGGRGILQQPWRYSYDDLSSKGIVGGEESSEQYEGSWAPIGNLFSRSMRELRGDVESGGAKERGGEGGEREREWGGEGGESERERGGEGESADGEANRGSSSEEEPSPRSSLKKTRSRGKRVFSKLFGRSGGMEEVGDDQSVAQMREREMGVGWKGGGMAGRERGERRGWRQRERHHEGQEKAQFLGEGEGRGRGRGRDGRGGRHGEERGATQADESQGRASVKVFSRSMSQFDPPRRIPQGGEGEESEGWERPEVGNEVDGREER